MKWLLRFDADPNAVSVRERSTPLMLALTFASDRTVAISSDIAKKNIEIQSAEETIQSNVASSSNGEGGLPEIVELLLNAGADPNAMY